MVYISEKFATEAEAITFRDSYLESYHPLGYGTYLRIEQDKDGRWTVVGSRGDSCD